MIKCDLAIAFVLLSIIRVTVTALDDYCIKDENGDIKCEATREKLIPSKPNIIILLADDLGYGDLASYGHPVQELGTLDTMAAMGVRFRQFYSADSMCSPSRVGLLTGRLPIRSGIVGGRRVFVDFDAGGLPSEELTLAEALKDLGYHTGFVGKWHLGINAHNSTDGTHLPSAHGFDFVGHNLPLTDLWQCDESKTLMKDGPDRSKCYVYDGDRIVQQPIAHRTLTDRYIADFDRFLRHSYDANPTKKPFAFYLSFHQVHTSLETAPGFKDSSRRGPFGDSVNELHDAVGRVLTTIRSRGDGLEKNTLIIFMSDHGPHREICTYGGSTGGLRGGKGNSFEGGVRVPAFAYWPGVVEPGVSDAIVSSLDLLPSLVALAGGSLPMDRTYDGLDAHRELLNANPISSNLHKRTLFFYCNEKLASIRHRNYKLHLLTSPDLDKTKDGAKYCAKDGRPSKDYYAAQLCLDGDLRKHDDPPLVFDLDTDPFEEHPLTDDRARPIWDKVKVLMEKHKKSIRPVEKQLGKFNPKVIPCCNAPKCECNYP